jgi:hypothetical protein
VFSPSSVPRGYKGTDEVVLLLLLLLLVVVVVVVVVVVREDIRVYLRHIRCITRVEAGSNTSTVILRVVGGDEKGSLKSETVKYGRESQGTRTRDRLRWQGPVACKKKRHPSSR